MFGQLASAAGRLEIACDSNKSQVVRRKIGIRLSSGDRCSSRLSCKHLSASGQSPGRETFTFHSQAPLKIASIGGIKVKVCLLVPTHFFPSQFEFFPRPTTFFRSTTLSARNSHIDYQRNSSSRTSSMTNGAAGRAWALLQVQ
jgi:hypothetical protein